MEARGVNGQVTFDGTMVTISRSGFIARATHGKGDKRIPIRQITAIQWKAPTIATRGFVSFTIGGGNEGRALKGARTKQAATDENSVLVPKKTQADFEALITAVEAAIAAL